jgi:hypothetical protein
MEDRYHEQLEAWRQRCFDMFLASGKRIDKDAYPERPEPPELPAELRGLTCGAKTRKGTFCKRRDLYTNGRCRMHGGPSTGPTSEAGKQRSALNGQHRKQRSQDVRGNDRWSKGAEPNP